MDHPQRTVKNSELANLSFDQFDPAYQAQILELRKIIDKRITAKQFQNFTITGTSTKEEQASLSCGCGAVVVAVVVAVGMGGSGWVSVHVCELRSNTTTTLQTGMAKLVMRLVPAMNKLDDDAPDLIRNIASIVATECFAYYLDSLSTVEYDTTVLSPTSATSLVSLD